MSGPKRGNPLDRFNTRYVVAPNGCWLWTGAKYSNGYGRFYIGRQDFLAHRTAYELLIEPFCDSLCVLHKCDEPSCVNPDHLFLGDAHDNLIDARDKGRLLGHQAKLTKEQVAMIRSEKHRYYSLANELGVSISTIRAIRNGEIWNE